MEITNSGPSRKRGRVGCEERPLLLLRDDKAASNGVAFAFFTLLPSSSSLHYSTLLTFLHTQRNFSLQWECSTDPLLHNPTLFFFFLFLLLSLNLLSLLLLLLHFFFSFQFHLITPSIFFSLSLCSASTNVRLRLLCFRFWRDE